MKIQSLSLETVADYPKDHCVHELFAAQAERTPEAVAVVYEDRQLSYAELDRRANQLGHHLRSLGVGPEVVVGLCAKRSLEMVVGLLGILKAGGAYLPLDPSYPQERLTYMLANTQASVLVTQAGLVDRVAGHDARVVQLCADWPTIAKQAQTAPECSVTPENLAYVIYTSGSTGKPKGVMIRHGGVVRYFAFLVNQHGLNSHDTVLHVSSISFDPSVRDLLGPLLVGARLVILNTANETDPCAYLNSIEVQSVTILLSITPSFLIGVCDAAVSSRLGSLRAILTCGEPLGYGLCARVKDRLGANITIVNQYGPTECTMSSLWFKANISGGQQGIVPIGRPISNTQVYILDGSLALTPIGLAGELYIGGAGLGRGYVDRAGLTAERFIPSPFGDGERLYRTGDLARWRRSDGELEYLGRIDHQVKIRGYRIELGEIETTLLSHPAVHQAVVVAREDTPGDKRLAAYVVSEQASGPAAEPSALRAHLQRSLPEYMVPSAFVPLDALPLTPNGKVDRQALPAPEGRSAGTGQYVAPRTPIEEVLASIWCEVLKLDRVGVHDNFFELGGHSLLAMPAVARVRDVFEVDLPLRELFEAPSVCELSVRVEAAQRERLGGKLVRGN